MSELPTRDILVFTGQGSNQHLSDPGSTDDLREQLGQIEASAFADFLLKCQNAFRNEADSVLPEDIVVFDSDTDNIRTVVENPDYLLRPPKAFQSHPVFEALTLYARQILELMAYQTQNTNVHVVETSGICTGVIPAILAASYTSYSSQGFVNAAVEGFRLAFWIGLRASLFCRKTSERKEDGASCVLSVFGIQKEALSEWLASYHEKTEGVTGNVNISATFNDENISLSGHGDTLREVKSKLSADGIECRWAHVHALFHRGTEMQAVLEKTSRDIETREIKFPDWKSLHSPVRAVTDGDHLMPGPSSHQRLVDVVLRSIFNDQVDWRLTSHQLSDSLLNRFRCDPDARYRILGFGPGSRSLLQFARDLSPLDRLEVIDNVADSLKSTSGEDIAIVGLSVNYPGAKGVQKFWDLLAEGTSVVSEIPTSRFDTSQLHGADDQSSSIKYGNFLTDPFDFDAAFFNISPREAKSMDPQQRLLLRGALEALDDAGYAPNATDTFQTNSMGVYVGVATCDYVDNLRSDIDVYYSPGTLRAFLSGRISYAFKLGGPSMVIDTACSSSMVAVHHACIALKSGECTAALAGGVNTISSPDMYCGLSRAHFLSPTGQCKPFDKSADGYCRSEGCGMIVLKNLSRAIEEGDHIYGVIRGTAINQCGTAKSITHPDAETQANLLRSVLKSSRTSAASIEVIEAHGTGTQAGDYAEVTSISSVFGRRPPENPLYVSSLKGNMGHSEAASGVASLAKLLMMMERRQIPPQASFTSLNLRLKAIETNGMVIPTQLKAWNRRATKFPRRALVNNFGASGSNAALVLEDFAPRPLQSRNGHTRLHLPKRSHHLLNLSAKTERALEALRVSYAAFLEKSPDTRLEDICYTVNARRPEYSPLRSSIIASSAHELLEQLQKPLQDTNQAASKSKRVFVFSGQGNIYNGMGADMISTVPLFRETVDKCDTILSEHGFPSVKPFLQDTRPDSSSQGKNDEIIIAQCACFVLEYALAVVWKDWGVIPDIVMGHSIGEYAAFAFTGSISLEDALLLLARRARLMANKCVAQSTGMLACRLPPEEARQILAEKPIEFEDVTIACFNSPKDVVLAGPPVSLAKLVQYCKAKGLRHKRLDVLYGFHSPAMDPILEELADLSRSLKFKPPQFPMGSSLYGRLLGEDEVVTAEYFVRHSREPVNFCGMAEEAAKSLTGFNIHCLEIGPSPSTEPMFKQIMVSRPYSFLTSLRPGRPAWATLASALRTLFLQGCSVQWRRLYSSSDAKFLRSFPGYPLAMTSYVVPYRNPGHVKQKSDDEDKYNHQPRFAFLCPTGPNNTNAPIQNFSTALSQVGPFIKAHQVGGVPLCPASVYLEIVLQGVMSHDSATDNQEKVSAFENVSFEHPLVYSTEREHEDDRKIKTDLHTKPAEAMRFSSTSGSDDVLCSGEVRSVAASSQTVADMLARRQARVGRLKHSLVPELGRSAESFSTKTIYRVIFPRVVQYDDPFMTLHQLSITSTGLEGRGMFRISPLTSEHGQFVSSPVFVDTLLHAPGFMANTSSGADTACICVSLEQALIPHDLPSLHDQDLQVYCSLVDIDHSYIADSYAIDANGRVIGYIEGMCFKKVKLRSFKAHLSRQAAQRSERAVPHRPEVSNQIQVPGIELSDKALAGRPPVDSTVISVIRDVCGIDYNPEPSSSLSEIGIDSLLGIELCQTLGKIFNTSVSQSALEDCATVRNVIEIVTGLRIPSKSQVPSLSATPGDLSAASSLRQEPRTPDIQVDKTLEAESNVLLKSLFLEVCGLQPTKDDEDISLSSLGVDSLLSIELYHELRDKLGVLIEDGHESISELTFRQLEDMCSAKVSPKSSNSTKTMAISQIEDINSHPRSESLVNGTATAESPRTHTKLLQMANEEEPRDTMYLFHDGSGLCGMYSRLGSLDAVVYGVHTSEDASGPHHDEQTMESLARHYIETVNLANHYNLILGGWSFGGVLAYEVSRQLSRLGKRVKGVILIDSPAPVNHQALPREIARHVLSRGQPLQSDAVKTKLAAVEAAFARHASMLQNYAPRGAGAGAGAEPDQLPCVIISCTRTMDTERLCGVSYPWLSDADARDRSIAEWEALIGRRIPVLDVDCDHFSPFEAAHVGEVTQNMRLACKILEQ